MYSLQLYRRRLDSSKLQEIPGTTGSESRISFDNAVGLQVELQGLMFNGSTAHQSCKLTVRELGTLEVTGYPTTPLVDEEVEGGSKTSVVEAEGWCVADSD